MVDEFCLVLQFTSESLTVRVQSCVVYRVKVFNEPILKDPKVKLSILIHPCSYVFLLFVDFVCFEHVWLN